MHDGRAPRIIGRTRRRRSIRLKGWDYSSPNYYFITLCVQNRECKFGKIENSEMTLNETGKMVKDEWEKLSSRFAVLDLDEFIIMPNHIHAILHIACRDESCIRPGSLGERKVRPHGTESGSIGRIIQAYKSVTTLRHTQKMMELRWPTLRKRLWQRNFFEHIIRSERELEQIRQYTIGNPSNWPMDDENQF